MSELRQAQPRSGTRIRSGARKSREVTERTTVLAVREQVTFPSVGSFSLGGRKTMTVTMTTLIEDVSNNCQSSGPVGTGDGVMTHRKKHRTSGRKIERCWLKRNLRKTVRRQCVEISPLFLIFASVFDNQRRHRHPEAKLCTRTTINLSHVSTAAIHLSRARKNSSITLSSLCEL